MKKAKIILTAIAVFSVVGGALAVKAKRTPIPAFVYFSKTVTESLIGAFAYTTTVNVCLVDPDIFVSAGSLTNTFVTSLITVTGFSAGNPRTWREVVCTTRNVLTTDVM